MNLHFISRTVSSQEPVIFKLDVLTKSLDYFRHYCHVFKANDRYSITQTLSQDIAFLLYTAKSSNCKQHACPIQNVVIVFLVAANIRQFIYTYSKDM